MAHQRSTVQIIAIFLAAILGFIAFFWQIAIQENTSYCHDTIPFPLNSLKDWKVTAKQFEKNSIECLFSKDYAEARELFLESAKLLNPEFKYLPVTDKLGTDVAIIPGDPSKYLIHISGVHGPEGFAGSASQSAILQYLSLNSQNYTNNPTMIFIHALNPYGMANKRRYNEDNIDLNRNFLTEEEFKFVVSRNPNFANYEDCDPMMNPTHKPLQPTIINDIYSYFLLGYGILFHGLSKFKRALVSGNYFKSTGLGYGGIKQAKSTSNLISLFDELNLRDKVKELLIIDVHTGLGPSGVDTIMIDLNKPTKQKQKLFKNIFQTELLLNKKYTGGIIEIKNDFNDFNDLNDSKESKETMKQVNDASSGYELTMGMLPEYFCDKYFNNLISNNKLCMTQEFGTISTAIVGINLMNENQAYHFGNIKDKEIYSQRLQHSFYLEDNKLWEHNIVRRGLKVFLEGIEYLNANKET